MGEMGKWGNERMTEERKGLLAGSGLPTTTSRWSCRQRWGIDGFLGNKKNEKNEKEKKWKEMREAYGKCGGRRGSRDEENGKKKWGQLVCVGNGRGV